MATIIDERAVKFWEFYKTCVGGMIRVVRSGYGTWGAYPCDGKFDDTRKISDLEHICAVGYLVYALSEFYPEFISKHEYSRFSKWGYIHELGEIDSGDSEDNGLRDEEAKDRLERKKINEIFDNTTPHMSKEANEIFDEFQTKETIFSLKAFSIDKFAAVMGGFLLELQGRGGRYSKKLERGGPISPRDEFVNKVVGSDRLVDMWSGDFIFRARKYSFCQYLEMYISIMQAAAVDVLKEKFNWIEKTLTVPYDPSLF